MSDVKTGLMFSPLTEKVYWGRMNVKTGMSVGDNQKDITSDFISIMLQKFQLNTKQNISCNGKTEAVVFVVDEEKANRYEQSKAMYEMLESVSRELYMLIDEVNDQRASHIHSQTETPPDYHDMQTIHEIQVLLAKARGENTDGETNGY